MDCKTTCNNRCDIIIMKKTIFLLLVTILMSCSDDLITNDFQLLGAEAEVPLFYFSNEQITGDVRGNVVAEVKADNNTEAEIHCTFHLMQLKAGRIAERDIITENFTLKKGETYKINKSFTFYGKVYDKASIVIDVTTKSKLGNNNPVKITNSTVEFLK